tara:strand:+ start:873 stop:1712 length:840 start_codon:yes stop_codon:yes gene_type:complete
MTFSGHDTFHCRLFWLKKGFDFIQNGENFQDDSGVYLGVGKNMVNSIRFWLKAFGITNADELPTELFENLLQENGWDPYLENEGTLWLLHYKLCSVNYASIYSLIFKELRKIKPEFTKSNFLELALEKAPTTSDKIINKDFSVFIRTYMDKHENTKEDSLSGLLTELNLLSEIRKNELKETVYRIENSNANSLPCEIILYCILENENYGDSISFKSFYNDEKGIGHIFVLTPEQLEDKLGEITARFPDIRYSNEAGVKVLQIKNRPNSLDVLNTYYNEA